MITVTTSRRREALGPSDETETPDSTASTAPNRRILLVEDEPATLQLLVDLFTDEGYDVQTATDGVAALQAVRHAVPNAIVADVILPNLTGDALAGELRDWGIPIILTSGYHDIAPPPGVTFIRKPFDLDALLSTVDHLIAATAAQP